MPRADGTSLETWRHRLGPAMLLLIALWRHEGMPPAEPTEPAAPPKAAPTRVQGVLWAGCDEVRLAAREGEPSECVVMRGAAESPISLRVWLPSAVTEPVVTLDASPLAADVAEVDDGGSLVLHPGRGGRLEISGKVNGTVEELLVLDLRLRPRPDLRLREQLDAAVGEPAAQAALAEQLRRDRSSTATPEARLLATRYLQYVTFDMGADRDAAALALEVADMARAQGLPLLECDVRWSASFILGEKLGDTEAALAAIGPRCGHGSAIPQVAMMGGYYEGVVAVSQGRYEDARRLLEQATLIARRLRWSTWEVIALNTLVETLAAQGRFAWARQVLERMQALELGGRDSSLLGRCEARARHALKLGELASREAELLGVAASAARDHWLESSKLYRDRQVCPDHPTVHDSLAWLDVELARLALDQGDLERAASLLDATHEHIEPVVAARRRLLLAELAHARGATDTAWALLEELAVAVDRGALAGVGPAERWQLHLTRARVLQGRGELRAALESLAKAQAELDEGRSAAPGVESDRQAAMRRRSSQLLVRLLLDHGQARAASCVARVARARGLASWGMVPNRLALHLVERWRDALYEGYEWYDPRDIPIDERLRVEATRRDVRAASATPPSPFECDQLPAPNPGEASLLYFHDGQQWLGFAWGATGRLVVKPLRPGPDGRAPMATGEALVSPFAEVLEGATRMRVLAPPVMADVSFADLEWNGRPLADAFAVAHAIDLPRPARAGDVETTATLVLSDPHRELHGTYEHLEQRFADWAKRLRAHGHRVTTLVPPRTEEDLGRREILEGTRAVRLALLYGFGTTQPSYYDLVHGRGPAAEPDQDGFGVGVDALTRADVLLDDAAPRHVILAHCDSATVDPLGASGAIGLAQAYVQAGAEWAVGTHGVMDPRSMEEVVDVLLDEYVSGSSVEDIVAAVQLAKQRLAAKGFPDGERLRVWAP